MRSYDNLFFTLVFIKTGVYSAQRFGDFAAKSKVNCVSAWVKRFASMYTELVKAFLGVVSSHGNLFIAIFVVFYNLYVGYAYIFLVKRYTLAWWPDFAGANSYRSAKCHRFYVWLYGQFIMSWLSVRIFPFITVRKDLHRTRYETTGRGSQDHRRGKKPARRNRTRDCRTSPGCCIPP